MSNNSVYFLHIPKTGGTSFISFLDNQFDSDEIFPGQLLPDLFQASQEELCRYKLFRGHLWYGLNSYLKKNLHYITMLRDPIKRTISWYLHVKRDKNAYRHEQVISENWSLDDFISDAETNWDTINAQTLFLAVDLDYVQLSRDPVGYGQAVVKQYASRFNDRALLTIAKQRLEKFMFFGITERMQESVYLLSYQMRWYPDTLMPSLNVSSRKISDEDIPMETTEAIRERTQLDQELYGWACQIFEERFHLMMKSLLGFYFELDENNIKESLSQKIPFSSEERRLFVIVITKVPSEVMTLETFQVSLEISNFSHKKITSLSASPVHVSYHWLNTIDHAPIIFDGKRTKISPSLLAGEKRQMFMAVEAPDKVGVYKLRVTMVQEGIAWFDQVDSQVFSDADIIVR